MQRTYYSIYLMIRNIIRCMPGGMWTAQHMPDRPESCIRYAASVIMGITYGKVTPTAYSDPEVIAVNRCLKRFGHAVLPGAYLVDTYPILQYVPGYLAQLKKWHQEELALFEEQLNIVRKQMVRTYDCHKSRDSIIKSGRRHGATVLCQIPDREPARVPN